MMNAHKEEIYSDGYASSDREDTDLHENETGSETDGELEPEKGSQADIDKDSESQQSDNNDNDLPQLNEQLGHMRNWDSANY